MKRQRYAPHGILALAPKAFGFVFDVPDEPTVDVRDGVAVVSVRGPLMHHREWCFDSYDAIIERVSKALEGAPKAVVLAIDSPGGLVNGCFEASKTLRSMAEAAGVPLVAYVDGQATSAAYAMACAAERIVAPETGMVGSIGVIDALVDATAQDAMFGVQFRLVASGARKADGNPHTPTSDEAVAAAKGRVDSLAGIFAAWVEETRPITGAEVLALEAGVLHGAEAVTAGLVDELGSLDSLLAQLASGQTPAAITPQEEGAVMASNFEESIAKLRKAAEGDDEEAKVARRMLAAMDEDKKPKDEPDGDEGKA